MKFGPTMFLVILCISYAATTSAARNDSGILSKLRKLVLSDQEREALSVESFSKGRRFVPFARPVLRTTNITNLTDDRSDDSCSSSDDDFPTLMSDYVLNHGGVVICFVIGIYCFTLLAIVCDSYFLPTVERLCVVFNMSPDVAAASFMSIATSCPELFTNIIGTFITESDMGIGTIVGSSMFNALGVASLGGLAASKPIQMDWWPVTRDASVYILAVGLLVGLTWDGIIWWYEGMTLFIVYFVYMIAVFQNDKIARFVKGRINRNKVEEFPKQSVRSVSKTPEHFLENNLANLRLEQSKEDPNNVRVSIISDYGSYAAEKPVYDLNQRELMKEIEEEREREIEEDKLFSLPKGSLGSKILFYYTWPLRLILHFTIPSPIVHPRLFPISFLMCIIWIGLNSYVVSWMLSYIGDVLNLPDAVLGMTFLAAGGCLPESISITIMSRRGEGKLGVSNSLGANTMNILLSLGMPWFFKTISKGINSESFIKIQSGSLEYTILALALVVILLYITLYINKFRLSRPCGAVLMCIYIVFIVMAILSEMVFFPQDC